MSFSDLYLKSEKVAAKLEMSPGSWSPPRARQHAANARGEAKPLHHVKVARHRRGGKRRAAAK